MPVAVPHRLNSHPLLENAIGHCAGATVFGILLYLFLVDWARSRSERSRLSAIAAALALAWNAGSLFALARGSDSITLASFCLLSLVPAVLLHISIHGRYRFIPFAGYAVGLAACALHLWDAVTGAEAPHRAALLLITVGFGGLTSSTLALDLRNRRGQALVSRTAVSMCLFLLAASFVHFEHGPGAEALSVEFAIHHAGIPLALFVLLYDYRFLFIDAFLRFAVNGLLAGGSVLLCIALDRRFGLLARSSTDPFFGVLLFAAACAFLAAFTYLKQVVQRGLTRALFRRDSVEPAILELQMLGGSSEDEQEYIARCGVSIASFFGSELTGTRVNPPESELRDAARPLIPSRGAGLVIPIHFSSGDVVCISLGPRRGGRPYLSEDLEIAARLGKIVEVNIERRRQDELQALASRAELRALQSQINPHFLFNALNTLYGTIGRENAGARRLVLNLSDVFRYFLKSERTFIAVAEELKIVRAYLEIEELRLGEKLKTSINADSAALRAEIPVLSIQPLVENAVKHGVAPRAEAGFVRINVTSEPGGITIEVENSGHFEDAQGTGGTGVGLNNVRRRLQLCYGRERQLEIHSGGGSTRVLFRVPAPAAGREARGEKVARS